MMRNRGTGSRCLACWLENGLEGQVICLGMMVLYHRAWIGVSVQKCFRGAGNLMRN